MKSKDWAQAWAHQYIEATDGIAKPWLLIQRRLKLLQDQRATLAPATYRLGLAALHPALISLGKGWQGQEAAGFATGNLPGESR